MNKKESIEQEIQKTLDKFDLEERLPPDFNFYARIQMRLERQTKRRITFLAVLKPVLLIVLIAMNIGTAFWYFSQFEHHDPAYPRRVIIEIMAADLGLDGLPNRYFIFE